MSASSSPTRFAVQDRVSDACHTLVLSGELDLLSLPDLQAAVRELCANGTSAVVLDLSGITFIDAAGLRSVLFANDLCERRGYSCSLVPAPRHVQTLFEVTGLIDVLAFNPPCHRARVADGEILRRLWRRSPVMSN